MVARSCAIGTASTVCARLGLEALPGQPLDAGRRGPLADADRDHAGREQQDVAALDVLEVRAVHPRRADEPRVPAVDQLGQLGLALAGRHRQRGDRDPVAHPHRRVAGEEQVGQRVDEEVVVGQQRGDQAEAAAHLVVADAGGEVVRQLGRRGVAQQPLEVAAHRVAEVEVAQRLLDRVGAGVAVLLEGLGEQVGEVEHLDVAAAQLGRERVVLVLRARHPRDAVEEQLVVVARGEPLQLRPGPVQHHRPQPADLAVRPVRCPLPRSTVGSLRHVRNSSQCRASSRSASAQRTSSPA